MGVSGQRAGPGGVARHPGTQAPRRVQAHLGEVGRREECVVPALGKSHAVHLAELH